MTTGRINQVTFHQRHSSAARDWGLGHFRSTFSSPNAHFGIEDGWISRAERFLLLSPSLSGFPHHQRQNPAFLLLKLKLPFLQTRPSHV